MTQYFEESEGGVPDDLAATELFAAMVPGGIRLLPMDDVAALPCTKNV